MCQTRHCPSHDCGTEFLTEDCDLRFCWIKADPTFEGLQQVLYEPEDRVRIQEKDPTPSRHSYTLSERESFSETKSNDELSCGCRENEYTAAAMVLSQ